MGRNRPERQSGRVLAVKLGVVLVGLVILLALGYAGGRYLEKRRYTETRGELKDGFGEVPTVEIDGVTYEQKMNVTSLLMIGIDKRSTDENKSYRDGGQSDFLLLLVLDHKNKTIHQLQIDRDTMTSVNVLGLFGNSAGSRVMQICLSHGYGMDRQERCKNTLSAVQGLLGCPELESYMEIPLDAIAALNDLGIRAGSVYGTSVGALNAAMYAQDDMTTAEALWSSIRLSDVVSEESLAIADDAENIFDHPEKLLEFITRYAHQKGVDVSPLMEILHRLIDEDRVRRSGVRLGVVTTRFPSLAMVEKRLEEMEAGSLHDWLMASASCFPIFPMKQVGGDRYIDGGFCDNTPVEMAVRSGARDIIAIDIGKHRSHTQYDRRPNVTYIRTSQPLGGLLTLDSALSARNRTLGYNDVMRAFGRMRGVSYAFDAVDAQALYTRAQDYVVRLTQVEMAFAHSNALTRKRETAAPFFSLLEEELPEKADGIDYFLRGCELCAQAAEVNPAQVLTFAALRDELRARLPLEKAESMLGSLLGGRIGVLFAKPQIDRRLVIACLYQVLLREGSFSPLALRTLSAFPREMLCAMTLQSIL